MQADDARSHDIVRGRLGIFGVEARRGGGQLGFYYWRGGGARLGAVLLRPGPAGPARFHPMLTLLVVREHVFFGTGYLPFFADEANKIEDSDLLLIGTSSRPVRPAGPRAAATGSCMV